MKLSHSDLDCNSQDLTLLILQTGMGVKVKKILDEMEKLESYVKKHESYKLLLKQIIIDSSKKLYYSSGRNTHYKTEFPNIVIDKVYNDIIEAYKEGEKC